MFLTDFDYELPIDRIAQQPLENRSDSKMLVINRARKSMEDSVFQAIGGCFQSGDLLIFNRSKVQKSRLIGRKSTGGKIEVFLLKDLGLGEFECLIKTTTAKKSCFEFKIGDELKGLFLGAAKEPGLFLVRLECIDPSQDLDEVIEKVGQVPLPPYINRNPTMDDENRYQTIYAKNMGSVAAPTAGLHFSESIFVDLQSRKIEVAWIDLHVGLGTFQPIKVENINEHQMHCESFSISQGTADQINRAKREKRKVIAVGTTTVRALESCARKSSTHKLEPMSTITDLFLQPGSEFMVVDQLLTNFHQPKSSLLVLISAFMGLDFAKRAYAHALGNNYRFLSYGDCMLIQ